MSPNRQAGVGDASADYGVLAHGTSLHYLDPARGDHHSSRSIRVLLQVDDCSHVCIVFVIQWHSIGRSCFIDHFASRHTSNSNNHINCVQQQVPRQTTGVGACTGALCGKLCSSFYCVIRMCNGVLDRPRLILCIHLIPSVHLFLLFFCCNSQVTARFPNNVKKELEVSFYQVKLRVFLFYFSPQRRSCIPGAELLSPNVSYLFSLLI